ncbi:PH domain-like protein [Durotheca rogersii]|uniref:PH domain-like protein n=1 Tax=Durotheca rogersii TaxID=419775 RepID=UPI002220C57A|nr:PH domain-like protein [Durotheca rogersii]KAI5865407.1 PH domain-like protein [Durotheca rogersii]
MSQQQRRPQNRGQPGYPSSSLSHSPHSQSQPPPQYQHHHQQPPQHPPYHQLPPGHVRNRSQQLRAEAAEEQLQFSGASDYESDTAHYMASHPAPSADALASRTNTELNLKVLRRYRPAISTILSIAANAVVYTFTPPGKWDKSNMEGTLFICAQKRGGDGDRGDRGSFSDGCLFILNRKSLQNLVIDLASVTEFEPADNLLIFNLDDAAVPDVPMENGDPVRPNVLGMWIYAEDEQDQRTNAAVIREMWAKARAASADAAAAAAAAAERSASADSSDATGSSASAASRDGGSPITQMAGRQVSLGELFGRGQTGSAGRGA